MTIVRAFVVAFLLIVGSAFGQYPLAIDPPDPTSRDPVTLIVQQFDSCPPPPDVTRSGFDITVTVHYGLCLSPPALITLRIELGTLPAGQYNVVAKYDGGQAPVTSSFAVLDANLTVLVSQSIGSSAGGT